MRTIKVIRIGDSPYQIEYSEENSFKIFDLVLEWMQEKTHSASHSGEGIFQNDECLIDAPTLISDIVDDVLKPKYLGDDNDDDIF